MLVDGLPVVYGEVCYKDAWQVARLARAVKPTEPHVTYIMWYVGRVIHQGVSIVEAPQDESTVVPTNSPSRAWW